MHAHRAGSAAGAPDEGFPYTSLGNELWLLHGTRLVPPEAIWKTERGVDPLRCEKGMFGRASYFALQTAYVDSGYAHTSFSLPPGHAQMFLMRVAAGRIQHKDASGAIVYVHFLMTAFASACAVTATASVSGCYDAQLMCCQWHVRILVLDHPQLIRSSIDVHSSVHLPVGHTPVTIPSA
jgi:hypothetical protein